MVNILAIILVLIAGVISAVGALFLKKGANKFVFNIKELVKNTTLIFGVLMFIITLVLYMLGLRRGELSILYPITSLTYVWVCLLSIKYLNEKMNKLKWLGIILIVAGVSLMTI